MSAEVLQLKIGEEVYKAEVEVRPDGKINRVGEKPQLGKRFICGQELKYEAEVPDAKDPNKKTIVKRYTYISGEAVKVEGEEGKTVDCGCGTEFLVLKPSENIIYCCDMPTTQQKPKALPSSD